MSKRAASPSLDAPNMKRTRNQISPLSNGDKSVNQEAGYQPQADDNEVILLDKAQVAESSSSWVHPSFPSRVQDTPALQDTTAWDILEHFLTTDLTFRNMETKFHAYLGHHHDPSDWTEARQALFSVYSELQLEIMPSSIAQNLEADDAEDEDEEEEEVEVLDFEPGQAKVTHLPSRKHMLSDAVARIEEMINHSGSIYAQCLVSLPPPRAVGFIPKRRMQFIADHLENQGLEIVISPWIPSHIYITSDSPRTILSMFPDQYKSSIKNWDVVKEDEQAEVNMLRLQFPYPAWLRIKRGKYRDGIAYLFDCKQSDNFVTVLVPPRDFPYIMPKGSIALFNPSRLPTRISPSAILRNGEVIGYKYEGEEYYGGLLKKHSIGTQRITLEFNLDGRKQQMKATLAEIEQVFNVGDEVRVVAGVYSGVEGHIVLKYDENFTICQSSTQEEIQVSKYYLDLPQYVDPPEEAKSIEIGDCIRVTIGDLIGRSGLVLWVSGEFVWFQDDNDLLRDKCDSKAPALVKVNASMVECMCLPATVKFTRERGYYIRPGDMEISHSPLARSVMPPPERIIPVDASPSIPWASWSPGVLAAFATQTDNAGPSNQAKDPWTVNPSDTVPTVEPAQHNPREPIIWLREFALKFHCYHALFNISAGFQGGKLIKHLANSDCPDPFCGPNNIAPPSHIAAWCTTKTAGGIRMDYHIPVKFLTPNHPRRKNQECFVMNGDHRGVIITVAKCNLKTRTVEFQLTSTSTLSFDDLCVVEHSKDMQ
ncbi:hypothetical protein EV702DRAFT_1225171 [Suillus placidus]|uniref:KOW domain-containing protein n=1 Tax=Suillus placidus TaxID=48579 RepID=A0A9P6ZXF4_9AGAM|nr:hypothetical protein EV702DRAFT_1225171 [Suillus placidus]